MTMILPVKIAAVTRLEYFDRALLREKVCVVCDICSDQGIVTGSKLPQRIHHVIIHAMSVSILASWSSLLTEKYHVKRHDCVLSNAGNIVYEMLGAKNSVIHR